MKFLKIVVLLLPIILLSVKSNAQLLEDTDQRLKTSKAEPRKFFLFRLFPRKPAPNLPPLSEAYSFGRTSTGRTIQPNLSSGSPFRLGRRQPTARFSTGSPFGGRQIAYEPAYSRPVKWPSWQLKPLNAFSGPKPFTKKDYPRRPFFSGPSPFAGKNYASFTIYSGPKPFTKRDNPLPPIFSGPSPFVGKKYHRYTIYSGPKPFTKKDNPLPAVFSGPKPFTKRDYPLMPYFSGPSPFYLQKYKIRVATTRTMTFNLRLQKMLERINPQRRTWTYLGPYRVFKSNYYEVSLVMTNYIGPYKLRLPSGRNMHPSFRYHKEQQIASEFWRDFYHHWSVFWASANRNSEVPKGVREKYKKPKFDRKERHIWNN